MTDFTVNPIAAWVLRAVITHFPDGRQQIKEGLKENVFVQFFGVNLSVRIDWRDRTKPAEGWIFTRNGLSVSEMSLTIYEPYSNYLARNGKDKILLNEILQIPGMPEIPALLVEADQYWPNFQKSDYRILPGEGLSFQEIMS